MANPFLVKDSIAATVATTTTWFDSSSNNLDLTATNSPTLDTLGDATSEYNPFWTLDGVDQYLVKSNDANLNFGASTDFSLEVIFRGSKTGSTQSLFMKGDQGGSWYGLIISSENNFRGQVDDGVDIAFSTSDTTVTDGEWHHGVVTFDRDSVTGLKLYLDGDTEGTDADLTDIDDIDDAGQPLAVGVQPNDLSSWPFGGGIALVRIWNRALSSGEVATQYNGGDPWKVQAPTADQWGASTERITASKDRDFTGGGTNWANAGGLNAFDDTTDLTIVADGTNQFCQLALTNFTGGFVIGESYRIAYDHTERAAGWNFVLAQTGDDLVIGAAVAGTQNYLDWLPQRIGLKLSPSRPVAARYASRLASHQFRL